ncbi:hypothetical protein [Roseivivax sp. CAU 1761]
MPRRLTAITLALATALTAPATPAAADQGREILQALGGIAALYAVGRAIENARDREEKEKKEKKARRAAEARAAAEAEAERARREAHARDRDRRAWGHRPWRDDDRPRWSQRKHRDYRDDRRLLPVACLTHGRIRGEGVAPVFGARCLETRYRRAAALPRHCLVMYAANGPRRAGYHAACLRQAGYRLGD